MECEWRFPIESFRAWRWPAPYPVAPTRASVLVLARPGVTVSQRGSDGGCQHKTPEMGKHKTYLSLTRTSPVQRIQTDSAAYSLAISCAR